LLRVGIGGEIFKSALEFSDNDQFSAHLLERSQKIKDAISDIFGRIPNASPDVLNLQSQLASALAEEKVAIARCQGLDSEKQQLTDRLETASYRYLKAEKAVERAKSLQVQKLERQAILGGNGEISPSTSKRAATPIKHEANGELENGVPGGESDTARKEAVAVAEQRKKQLEDLEAENDRLTNELSAARTKVASLKDEDYAETALFKTFKLQHEDVIKRVNDLEATNVQLREEAQKYQAERTQHRAHIEEDNRAQTTDNESMIARIEVDLARIRNSRDELTSELAIRKSTDDEKRISSEQIKELAAAKDIRITALESEVERLKLQVGEAQAAECDHSGMNEEALRSKLRTLENQYNLLSQELPSMEAAWKKTQALAAKKVAEVANSEELVIKLNAEKSKAEQKYFAAMKAKDAKESELRVLKSQNARSSEIVSQLKDADSKTRELVISLERQIAEAKDGLTKLEQQQRAVDQKHKEATTITEGLRKQIEDLNALTTAKDKDCLAAAKGRREAEDALEQLKVRLEETKKSFESLRKAKATVNNSSAEDWRVSPIPHLLANCNHLLIFVHSNSPSALFALQTFATLLSSFVVTFSARPASKTSFPTAHGSAPAAANHLAQEIL
jgi:E3 ubiquitin-protein ligase BRE1